MKRKHLSLAIAALVVAGGLWFAREAWRTPPSRNSSLDADLQTPEGTNFDANSGALLAKVSQTGATSGPNNRPKAGQMLTVRPRLAPPDPTRRFREFTPEQRVEFARRGHGPGG